MPSTAEFIAQWEGLRRRPYHDVAGYPTIGVGHKLSNDKWTPLDKWPAITREHALQQLDEHLAHFRAGVGRTIRYRLQPDEETALVSFAFNLGLGSLSVFRPWIVNYMRADSVGNATALVLEWLDWCKATIDGRKQVVEGLLNRRRAEVALFFGMEAA